MKYNAKPAVVNRRTERVPFCLFVYFTQDSREYFEQEFKMCAIDVPAELTLQEVEHEIL